MKCSTRATPFRWFNCDKVTLRNREKRIRHMSYCSGRTLRASVSFTLELPGSTNTQSSRMSINQIQVRDTFCQSPGDEADGGDRLECSGEARSCAALAVEASILHMKRHLTMPLRISTLSSITGFSESHFATLFKSATGLPPKKFFLRLQMQRACKMFLEGTASVKEVALALGYMDQFHFSRVFKSVTGTAPCNYRRQSIGLSQPPPTRDGRQSPRPKVISESSFWESPGLKPQASA